VGILKLFENREISQLKGRVAECDSYINKLVFEVGKLKEELRIERSCRAAESETINKIKNCLDISSFDVGVTERGEFVKVEHGNGD
jgi:hypothetical protein